MKLKLHFLMMGFDENLERNDEKTFLVSFKFRYEDDLLKQNPETIDSKEYFLYEPGTRKNFATRDEAETAVRFILDHTDDLDAIMDYFREQGENDA